MNFLPAFQKPHQINKGKIFFDARSAKYRGDFIGFKNTLPVCPVVIPDQIFSSQARGFSRVLSIELTIKPSTLSHMD
jgi:hypothetical protein